MYYSVCASSVFGRLPLCETLEKIKAAGGNAYEFWKLDPADVHKLAQAQKDTGMTASAMCSSFIPLTDPEKRSAYIGELKGIIGMAKLLGIKTLIAQAGPEIKGLSREAQHMSIVEGLKECAPLLEKEGITLAVEPLNTLRDHPGYFLPSSKEAFDIVDEVGSPFVKVLFDIYHQQISEGNILENLLPNLAKVAHIHIAGNPGRHEPFENSEIDYVFIIKKLMEAGYNGAVGIEYFPLREPAQSLKMLFEKLPALK